MAEFVLELLNGNWGMVSAALAVMSGFYLIHETLARRTVSWHWRERLTQGMRNAVALFTMSVGVFIRSAETFRWRVTGGSLDDLSKSRLLIGGVIAIVGFLCMIRELSKPLYGDSPWIWTLVAMVLFTISAVGFRLF